MSRYETDDEQVEAIKSWWKQNGTSVLSSILVLVLAWSGWNYWNTTNHNNAVNASTTFEVLQIKMQQGQFGDVIREGMKLIDEQPDSPYASGVALLLAKYYFDKGESDKAITQLSWVAENALNTSTKLTAKLRLVNLYLDQGNTDKAAEMIASVNATTLSAPEKANFDYVSAEVAVAKADFDAARVSLQMVLDNKEASANLMNVAKLQLGELAQ